MPDITISIPEEMGDYSNDLRYFFDTMVRKLFTNRHKGFSKDFDINGLIGGARKELNEVEQALDGQGQFEVAVEAADVANFAFLIGLAALTMTREDFDLSRKRLNSERMQPQLPKGRTSTI